jgi:hypothetical protein
VAVFVPFEELVAVTLVGAPGVVSGKTTAGADSGPLPAALLA